MSFTVVPIHNFSLPATSVVPFGRKFVIKDVPEWLKEDNDLMKRLSDHDRSSLLKAKQAFVSEYEADSYGHPDPDWKGVKPKGIQDLRAQSALLANMAIWLIQPSALCFTSVFHALTSLNGRDVGSPFVNSIERPGVVYCQPTEESNSVTWQQLVKAGPLFDALDLVTRNNAVWSALRASSAALTSFYSDYRYPLFWQGLESLFGSDTDRDNVSQRLRNRISRFICSDRKGRKDINKMVERCYYTRCQIVHGRWENDPTIEARINETESIVRTVLINLAKEPDLMAVFVSTNRDTFLEAWEKERSFSRPPFP